MFRRAASRSGARNPRSLPRSAAQVLTEGPEQREPTLPRVDQRREHEIAPLAKEVIEAVHHARAGTLVHEAGGCRRKAQVMDQPKRELGAMELRHVRRDGEPGEGRAVRAGAAGVHQDGVEDRVL